MLTHCPECKGELSTQASTCPHCGAPVNHGHMAGGPVMKPMIMSAPPKSHFLKNCCGCVVVLVILFVVFAGYVYMRAKKGWMGPEAAPAVAMELAPGSTPPAGWAYLGADDITIFGKRMSKAVLLSPGGLKPEKGKPVSLMGAGALVGVRPEQRAQLHQVIEQVVEDSVTGGQRSGRHSKIVSDTEETFALGAGAGSAKVNHIISENEDTKERRDTYLTVLEPFDNDFGWLVLFATGPEKSFDPEAFRAYVGSVHTKSGAGAVPTGTTPTTPGGTTPPTTPLESPPPPAPTTPVDPTPAAPGSGK